jgi:hypothetical protein
MQMLLHYETSFKGLPQVKIQSIVSQAALSLALAVGSHTAFAVTYSNYDALPPIGFGVNGSNDLNMDGEIFTAPTDGTLNDLTFYHGSTTSSGVLEFVISAWNPTVYPNPYAALVSNDSTPLFSQTVTISPATSGPSAITISNINLAFTAGQSFLGYFTDQSPTGTGSLANYVWPGLEGVFSPGNGGFGQSQVHRNVTVQGVVNPFSDPLTKSLVWNGGPSVPGGNLMFNANFTPTAVPEPESYGMLLAGLGLIGAAVKRRKDKQA